MSVLDPTVLRRVVMSLQVVRGNSIVTVEVLERM